jgi:Tol biopolymer transport system component
VYGGNVDGDNEIFVVNSDGTGLTQLTNNTADDRYVSISGDGTKVAFHSNVDGDNEIFVVNSDGTGLTQLTSDQAINLHASISRDGTKVAFTSDLTGDNEICVVASDSLNITPTPKAGFSFPLEYTAGIAAVTVAVALVVSLVRKKWV